MRGVVIVVLLGSATALADSKVTVGIPPYNPGLTFPTDAQGEPCVAQDPTDPSVLVAGANDGIDDSQVGAGGQGIYFSFDRGATWVQPAYFIAGGLGPIGTVPNFFENGLKSGSDPALAFGPRPGPDGFSWANGSRLYHASIANDLADVFPGRSAIAVSRTDDVRAAAAGDASAWSAPVIVTRQDQETFEDKEELWVDNAESSPYFGSVYVCNTDYRVLDKPNANAPSPIVFARSTDGGEPWTMGQLGRANDTVPGRGPFANGRSGCAIRTDSHGVVYVFWAAFADGHPVQVLARSFDGGRSFHPARPVADVVSCGQLDPVSGLDTFDGVAGTRTNSLPTIDIANGAPSGAGAPDTLVLSWCDAGGGVDHEAALVSISTDGGDTWSAPVDAAADGDRPAFPAVAIAPGGRDLYVTYDAFLQPWQADTSSPPLVQGVGRHADLGGVWTDLHRGLVGDARGTYRRPNRESIYDYNWAVATDDDVVALWMDARNAVDCPAEDAYRESLLGPTPLPEPSPATDCPVGFANLDIYAASLAH